MSITLKLYNQSSPTNKIDKNLGNALGTVVANPNGTINVLDPVFIIDSLDAASYSNLGDCNYLIAEAPLNRRYFVVAVDFTVAKTAIITCHCDVLSTYASQLGTLNFVRGAGDINEMDDSSYPISDYMVQQYYPISNWIDIFKSTGSDRQYLLRTVAGTTQADTIVEIQDGAGIWTGITVQEGDPPVTKYRCYQIHQSGTRLYGVAYTTSQITGIQQVYPGDYIQIGNEYWKVIVGPSYNDWNPEAFQYFGVQD